MSGLLSDVIALAPVMIPDLDGTVPINMLVFDAIKELVQSNELDKYMFGPDFDQKVRGLCDDENLAEALSDYEGIEACQGFTDTVGTFDGYEKTSTRLLEHFAQQYLIGRFQEYSECWSAFECHVTEAVQVNRINDTPITMVFGDLDILSSFDLQKELIYDIQSIEGVHFLPAYQHFQFMGFEPDESLQNLVLAILNGEAG